MGEQKMLFSFFTTFKICLTTLNKTKTVMHCVANNMQKTTQIQRMGRKSWTSTVHDSYTVSDMQKDCDKLKTHWKHDNDTKQN